MYIDIFLYKYIHKERCFSIKNWRKLTVQAKNVKLKHDTWWGKIPDRSCGV